MARTQNYFNSIFNSCKKLILLLSPTSNSAIKITINTVHYKPPVYLLLSGGIDSTALIHFFKIQDYPIHPVFIDYGQPSLKEELKAVRKITRYFDLKHKQIKLMGLGKINKGELIGRNAMFICTTLMMKKKITAGLISLGIHKGALYSDSTEIFVNSMQDILDLYTDGKVKFTCPFIDWYKQDIILYCKTKRIPIEMTYSCELGLNQPCGKCKSCNDLVKFL